MTGVKVLKKIQLTHSPAAVGPGKGDPLNVTHGVEAGKNKGQKETTPVPVPATAPLEESQARAPAPPLVKTTHQITTAPTPLPIKKKHHMGKARAPAPVKKKASHEQGPSASSGCYTVTAA